MTSRLAEMELELRQLPGVLNVGIGYLESAPAAVTVVAVDPDPDLEASATKAARAYQAAATVAVVDLSAPVAPAPGLLPILERVGLVRITVNEQGVASVELAWRGSSAIGTGSGGQLVGPARATLGALEGLGIRLDAGLASVSTGRNLVNSPVRVILRRAEAGDDFVGIAQGPSAAESSARATLAAFNRYVAQQAGAR